jgi:hypothetical protein
MKDVNGIFGEMTPLNSIMEDGVEFSRNLK